MSRGRKFASGFTLVELLVVVTVIGALLAIILPAVQYAREIARRSTCQNNLRQLGLAIHTYEIRTRSVPIGSQSNGSVGFSWIVSILPDLELGSLYDQLDPMIQGCGLPATCSVTGTAINNVNIRVARCPSSPLPTFNLTGGYEVCQPSYVGIAGAANAVDFPMANTPFKPSGEMSAEGVLFANGSVGFGAVTDGLSNTWCVGECSSYMRDAKGNKRNIGGGYPTGWVTGTAGIGTPPTFRASTANAPPPPAWNITTLRYPLNWSVFESPGVRDNALGPNNPLTSAHSDGVMMLYLDGSVHLEHNSLDLAIIRRRASRADGQVFVFTAP